MSSTAASNIFNGQSGHHLTQAASHKKAGPLRRSTPDSEALLSSDDEHEPNPAMSVSTQSVRSVPAQRPIRRGSWLNEVRTAQRKYSLGGLNLVSSNANSQPPTPSADIGQPLEKTSSQGQLISSPLSSSDMASAQTNAVTTTSRGLAATSTSASQPSSFWGKKEGPRWGEFSGSPSFPSSATFQDVRSPTNTSMNESHQQPSTSIGIPFDIPLEPNRKTVRSQSYSAGQLDMPNTDSITSHRFKPKRIQPPSLARRTSRTVMENSTEFDLASVQEDPELQIPFHGGTPLVNEHARRAVRQASILSLENADMVTNSSESSSDHLIASLPSKRRPASSSQLPQASFEFQYPTSFTIAPTLSHRASQEPTFQEERYSSFENVNWAPEVSDHNARQGYGSATQIHSQGLHSYQPLAQQQNPQQRMYGQVRQEDMRAQNAQNATSQQQQFRLGQTADSRFHSANHYGYNQMANSNAFMPVPDTVPENVVTQTIQNAATEAQAVLAQGELAASGSFTSNQQGVTVNNGQDPITNDTMYNYFSGSTRSADTPRTMLTPATINDDSPSTRTAEQHLYRPMDQNAIYHGSISARQDFGGVYDSGNAFMSDDQELRNLYLVTFKASRAEVFVRPLGLTGDFSDGQMVIVEGDRGLDMGMISHCDLTREQAKILKAEYNRKHYNTLVRFSRNYPHLATNIVDDPDYEERASQNLADQALGPPGALGSRNGTMNPRSIRRVATEREIMLLREKEGNEARAKRICQGKVNQQHLSMEILDAEFQLDYRKLTFYFYSEEYIPFNAIVTDLFKVWKTRIWLSAVNPETYPAPPRRLGDQSRQPRRNHQDNRKEQSMQAVTAARRAYIRGAQDLAMGQFPGSLAATFVATSPRSQYQSSPPQQGSNTAYGTSKEDAHQGPFSPGRVVLPQGPFAVLQNNHLSRNLSSMTFGSLPPLSARSHTGNSGFGMNPQDDTPYDSMQGQAFYTANTTSPIPRATGPMFSSPPLRAASSVAEALASRGELPPAFIPSGQQQQQRYQQSADPSLSYMTSTSSAPELPGLGDLYLTDDRGKQHMQ